MSRPSFDRFRGILKSLALPALAAETRFSRRRARKVSPLALTWATILGAMHSVTRSVADIALAAGRYGAGLVSRQAIHKRLTTAGAVRFFERLCQGLMRQLARQVTTRLPGKLGRFRDICLLDSTVVALLARLARRFPACRTNSRKAALKVHACMSLTRKAAERLRLTHERVHDRRGATFGAWVRQRLVVFDLGYFDYGLFNEIKAAGGAFLTRLKSSANGEIVAVRSGCARRYVGTALNQSIYRGAVVDLDVWLGRGAHAVLARVIGLRNAATGDYHWYVTSLAPAEWSAAEVATVYGLRWQVERLFCQWKQACHLTRIRTVNEHLVRVLVYASLAFALLTALALALACRAFGVDWHATSMDRALTIMRGEAVPLGEALARRRRRRGVTTLPTCFGRLLEALALYAQLPNRTSAVLRAAGR